MKRGAPARASKEFWALAALEALSTGGLEAVAVEPVAKRLGVTKGSFYWHFESRAELLEAALQLWEERSTTGVIATLDQMDDPADRLRHIFRNVGDPAKIPAPYSGVHAALATATDPAVIRVLERITTARLGYVERCFMELGLTKAAAQRRAYLAYVAFLGISRLEHDAPSLPSSTSERGEYAEYVLSTLIPASAPKKKRSRAKRD